MVHIYLFLDFFYLFCLVILYHFILFLFFADKDPCRPNPCSHGGFCTEIGGGFACNCTLGFKGATCLGKEDTENC